MRYLSRPLTVLLILAFTGPIHGSEPRWPVNRGPAPSTAPYVYDADSLRDVPPEYVRDAAACYLYSGTMQTIEADGTVSTSVMEVIRLNARRGIDQLGEYRSIAFNPAYEQVTLHDARIHKASGATHSIGPNHVHVRDVNTDHQVYDPSKQVVISFPCLEVGDVIQAHWTVRGRHPEYQDQFFYRYTFGNEKYPVVRDEWTVRLPKERELLTASINGEVPMTVSEDGGRRVYAWKTKNRAAPPSGDRQPPSDEQRLQAACSTFPTWDAVYQWEKLLLAERSQCPPEAKRLVAELTAGISEPPAKARVLAQWVRRNVRYVSRGEKHDYTPLAPSRVLADRCGDCKDCAHMLAILMREAGLTAGVATLGPRGDGQVLPSLPSPWGTHALAVVAIDDRDHWIDTTAQRIGWDVLPRDDRNRACFITSPSGIRLGRTPPSASEDHRTESVATLTVAPNGDVAGECETRYFGLAAWLKREEYVDTPPADRRLVIASDLHDTFARAKLGKCAFDGLDDFESPLVVRTQFTVPELFAGDGTLEARLGDLSAIAPVLAASVNSERTVALDAGEPCESRARIIVKLPPVYRFGALPEPQETATRWGKLSTTVHSTDDPRRLEIESHFALTDPRVAPADFESWRDFQDVVQAIFRVAVAVKPTGDPADVGLLEAACAKATDDSRSAAALARIYIDQKKLEDASRILERARAAVPNERKLWELSLEAIDDIQDEERILRAMIKRFTDDPKLLLDLANNLLDQERPGDAQEVLEPLAKSETAEIKAQALIALAHSCLAQEEPKKALRHLRGAQKAHPASFAADAWFLKGQAHEANGEPRLAMEAYRQSLKDEEALDALEAITRLAIATGAKAEAPAYLQRLIFVVGDHPEGLALAADLAARLGRYDDALDLGKRALGAGKELNPTANRAIGLALFYRQEFGDAAKMLVQADADADGLSALIHSLVALGRLADAQTQATRLRSVEPNPESHKTAEWIRTLVARREAMRRSHPAPGSVNPEEWQAALDRAVCAEALYNRGLWPEVVNRLLNGALAGDVRPGPAFGLRAVIATTRGRFSAALPDAEQAILACPNEPYGYYARGRVRIERRLPGGLDDLERAVSLTERLNAAMLHDLASGYLAAGRKSDALSAQREAARLKPDDGEIRDQLRQIEK